MCHLHPLIWSPLLCTCSSLLGIPLPGYPRVRAKARRLPVSERAGHQVRCAGRAGRWEWDATLRTWGNKLRSCRKAREEVCNVTDVCSTAPPSAPSPAVDELVCKLHAAHNLFRSILLDSIQCIHSAQRAGVL
jgi:hypothetical protein